MVAGGAATPGSRSIRLYGSLPLDNDAGLTCYGNQISCRSKTVGLVLAFVLTLDFVFLGKFALSQRAQRDDLSNTKYSGWKITRNIVCRVIVFIDNLRKTFIIGNGTEMY